MLGIFFCFCCHRLFYFSFHYYLSQKFVQGTISECQIVWIQIRTDFDSPDPGSNSLQRLSADDKSPLAREELICL